MRAKQLETSETYLSPAVINIGINGSNYWDDINVSITLKENL